MVSNVKRKNKLYSKFFHVNIFKKNKIVLNFEFICMDQ